MLALWPSRSAQTDVLEEIAPRLQRNGQRQLAAARLAARHGAAAAGCAPPAGDIAGELGAGHGIGGGCRSLGTLLTRIGDAGGRYQCDDCGLHSVGWYWRCPKCRSWDSMRPAVFKWAEQSAERLAP